MSRTLRRLLLGLAGLGVVACLSPTLPMPPPAKPSVSAPDESGFARVQGVARPRAEVIAWNRANNLIAGQVTGESAFYDFKIEAQSGDVLEVWYILGADESPTVQVIVPEP